LIIEDGEGEPGAQPHAGQPLQATRVRITFRAMLLLGCDRASRRPSPSGRSPR
jgi:hypothetical protein